METEFCQECGEITDEYPCRGCEALPITKSKDEEETLDLVDLFDKGLKGE